MDKTDIDREKRDRRETEETDRDREKRDQRGRERLRERVCVV